MNAKNVEAEALGRSLDMVPTGIVLVSEDARILHANRAAERMIDKAVPVLSADGRLSTPDKAVTGELRRSIRTAAHDETGLANAGIGLALNGYRGPPATAHVLPVARRAPRSRAAGDDILAVFIASQEHMPPVDLEAVVQAFHLSPAEKRVLERLVAGDTLQQAAAALNIAPTTAKTHLSRLFAKTGTKRQAGLVALVNRLIPPVSPSDVTV